MRYFLLTSMLLAVIMPCSSFKIHLNFPTKIYENAETLSKTENIITESNQATEYQIEKISNKRFWTINQILVLLYLFGLTIFITLLFLHLFTIVKLYKNSRKTWLGDTFVLINEKIKSPFSFFKWIFIPKDLYEDKSNRDILTHERVHASQYHSIDILMIESLSALMWFNPLIWMMRKTIQLVHEYLADEGVLSTGIDKLKYQALLINQVAEERLICLSSSSNHSYIKKRMIMMTKIKLNQHSKLRILTLIPLAAILFIIVSCINGQKKSNVVTAVEPVRMNVLYVGVDNPIKIAASGYDASDLSASIDNGTISGENGEYVIRPKQPGSAIVAVSYKGKEIQKTTFRVKVVPTPVAKVAGRTGGIITKNELLKQEMIYAENKNFNFDLSFDIVEFTVLSIIKGYVHESKSNSNKITDKQKEIIANTVKGNPIYFQEIKCKCPDGVIRDIQTIYFRITE